MTLLTASNRADSGNCSCSCRQQSSAVTAIKSDEGLIERLPPILQIRRPIPATATQVHIRVMPRVLIRNDLELSPARLERHQEELRWACRVAYTSRPSPAAPPGKASRKWGD